MPASKELDHVKRDMEVTIEEVARVGTGDPLPAPPHLREELLPLWDLIAREGADRYRPEDTPLIEQYVTSTYMAQKFADKLLDGNEDFIKPWKQAEASVRMYATLLGASPTARFAVAAKAITSQRVDANPKPKNVPAALTEAAAPR